MSASSHLLQSGLGSPRRDGNVDQTMGKGVLCCCVDSVDGTPGTCKSPASIAASALVPASDDNTSSLSSSCNNHLTCWTICASGVHRKFTSLTASCQDGILVAATYWSSDPPYDWFCMTGGQAHSSESYELQKRRGLLKLGSSALPASCMYFSNTCISPGVALCRTEESSCEYRLPSVRSAGKTQRL